MGRGPQGVHPQGSGIGRLSSDAPLHLESIRKIQDDGENIRDLAALDQRGRQMES